MQFLALDVSGTPRRWISHEDVITYHAKKLVAYELGDDVFRFHGGFQKEGFQSIIESKPIVAIKGKGFEVKKRGEVILSNKTLFGRDRNTCAYCLRTLPYQQLSRDHIVPTSKGGKDVWQNIVCSCKSCNHAKGNKTLEDSGFKLHYVPYIPNYAEAMIIQNRDIRGDQMEFLMAMVPKHSRLL